MALLVGLNGQVERAERRCNAAQTRDHSGTGPRAREAFEQMKLIAAVEREQMDDEPDELRAGPVVRHVADFLEQLTLQRLLLAPHAGRRRMVCEGVENLRRLAAVALPEPGVAVEGGEIIPNAGWVPAGAIDHAFTLGRFQHRHGAGHQRIILGEDLSGIDGVAEGPLRALRKFLLAWLAHDDRHVGIAVRIFG